MARDAPHICEVYVLDDFRPQVIRRLKCNVCRESGLYRFPNTWKPDDLSCGHCQAAGCLFDPSGVYR